MVFRRIRIPLILSTTTTLDFKALGGGHSHVPCMSFMLFCNRNIKSAVNRHNGKQSVKGLQFMFNLATNLELLPHKDGPFKSGSKLQSLIVLMVKK
jgi:hypothetical protein